MYASKLAHFLKTALFNFAYGLACLSEVLVYLEVISALTKFQDFALDKLFR